MADQITPLTPFRRVIYRGTIHELDPNGHYCVQCGEMADWLIDRGGVAEV